MAKRDSESLKHTKGILEKIDLIKKGRVNLKEDKKKEKVDEKDNVNESKELKEDKNKENLEEASVETEDGGEVDLSEIESGDFVRAKDGDDLPAEGFGAVADVDEEGERILVAYPEHDDVWFDIDELEFVSKNPALENKESDDDKEVIKEEDKLDEEDRAPKKIEDIIPSYVYESVVNTLDEFQITADYDEESDNINIDDKEAKYFQITTDGDKFVIIPKFENLSLDKTEDALKELDEVSYILEQVRRNSDDRLF